MIGMAPEHKIRVRLMSWYDSAALGIYIFKNKGDDVYVAKADNGRLVFHPAGKAYEYIGQVEPTFVIPFEYAQDFKVGMMKALQEFGVELESESKIAGKLEATERHLDDMRSLVFKRKPDK